MAIKRYTLTATAGNDNKTIYEPHSTNQWVYTWNGLAGTDKLSFDRLPKSQFTIYKDAAGVHVDSVSSASHIIMVTLTNVEKLSFSNGSTIVDLVAMFGNKAPTGAVLISGAVRQGETLTASHTLADADGLGPVTYTWKADGAVVSTGASLTLTQDHVGKVITVTASYTDSGGTAESVTSATSSLVANVNDAPIGTGKTVTTGQGGVYQFAATDFGFSDLDPGDSLGAVRIDSLPEGSAGLLKLGSIPVSAGQVIELAQLPEFTFQPAAGVVGPNSASFNFSVRDAQLFDPTPKALTVDVTAANWIAIEGRTYHWKTHALLDGVALSFESTAVSSVQSALSLIDGRYELGVAQQGSYRVQANRSLGAAETGSAISAADALAALKLSVGINPNADPDGTGPLAAPPASPYQFLAADVNGDGRVTAADALAVLKMAVKRVDAPARDWLFVHESYDFWNESGGNGTGAFTALRTAVPRDGVLPGDLTIAEQSVVNLVAVLKGDVNASWVAPAGSSAIPDSYFMDLSTTNPLLIHPSQFGVFAV